MPWKSAQASKNAVRGCFGAAGKNAKKRSKCRKMAHEAHLWRMQNARTPAKKPARKHGGRK